MAYITEGNRGGKILVHEEHRYQKNKVTKNSIHWRCWRTNCRAPLQTNVFAVDAANPQINVLQVSRHIHEDDEDVIASSRTLLAMKTAVREDPSRPIKRVYDAVVRGRHVGGGDRAPLRNVREFHRVRTSLARVRSETRPQIPRSIEDVIIEGQWAETWSGEMFLRHLDNDWGVAIFATEENLFRLRRCPELYMDGTFRTCPRPYTQFFTIHGKYRNRVLPLVVCMLTGKTVGHYRQVFQAMKREVRRVTGHNLRPQMIISDFEQAIITAVETEFPRARVMGCYFHFCQSLWRKVQDVCLSREYRQNERLKKCIRKFLSIGYLPLAPVRLSFGNLRTCRRTLRLVRRYPGLQDFIEYMERNYINGLFPPPMWNVHDRDMDNRTNNHVEGYHNGWNQAVQVRHPSIWAFITHMKDAQANLEVSADAADRGDQPRGRRLKWRLLGARTLRLKSELQNGERNMEEYWNAILHCVANFL